MAAGPACDTVPVSPVGKAPCACELSAPGRPRRAASAKAAARLAWAQDHPPPPPLCVALALDKPGRPVCLSFSICKMGVVVPSSGGPREDETGEGSEPGGWEGLPRHLPAVHAGLVGRAQPPTQSGCRRGPWPGVLLGQMPFSALTT